MSRLTNQLDHVCDDLLRSSHLLPEVLRRMDDAEDPLRGQSFEPSSAVPRLYCMIHEGDLADCPEHDLCTGHPIDAPSDPVGEAAVRSAEHEPVSRRDRKILEDAMDRMARDAATVVRVVAAWNHRAPTDQERRATDMANEEAVGCEVCARSAKYVPAKVAHSDAKGCLDRGYRLCVWHLDFALTYERLPSDDEEARHQAGKRVVVRQTDRLRQGILTGKLS